MPVSDKTRKKESEWTDAEVVKLAKNNHIWLNAFSTLPGPRQDETALALGRMVIDKLLDSPMSDDLSSFPLIYLRVNAS